MNSYCYKLSVYTEHKVTFRNILPRVSESACIGGKTIHWRKYEAKNFIKTKFDFTLGIMQIALQNNFYGTCYVDSLFPATFNIQ